MLYAQCSVPRGKVPISRSLGRSHDASTRANQRTPKLLRTPLVREATAFHWDTGVGTPNMQRESLLADGRVSSVQSGPVCSCPSSDATACTSQRWWLHPAQRRGCEDARLRMRECHHRRASLHKFCPACALPGEAILNNFGRYALPECAADSQSFRGAPSS